MREDAEKMYERCIKSHPDYREGYLNYAQMLAYSNRPQEALVIIEEMEKKSVRYNDWRIVDWAWRKWKVNQVKADAMMWLKKYEEAKALMDEAEADIVSEDDRNEAIQQSFYADLEFLNKKLREKE